MTPLHNDPSLSKKTSFHGSQKQLTTHWCVLHSAYINHVNHWIAKQSSANITGLQGSRYTEIAPNGTLAHEWEKLFIEHADRVTIGSDTWVNAQWDNYEEIIAFDRHWLAQLPPEVAEKIAYGNAKRLFE